MRIFKALMLPLLLIMSMIGVDSLHAAGDDLVYLHKLAATGAQIKIGALAEVEGVAFALTSPLRSPFYVCGLNSMGMPGCVVVK